jgi:hypothetical protein
MKRGICMPIGTAQIQIRRAVDGRRTIAQAAHAARLPCERWWRHDPVVFVAFGDPQGQQQGADP